MSNSAPAVTEVMEQVARMAEALYPGFAYATIMVRIRVDVPEAVLPVTRLSLHLPDVASGTTSRYRPARTGRT